MTAPRINSSEHRAAQAEAARFEEAVDSVRGLDAKARAHRQLALNNLLVAMVCGDIASDQFADAGKMIGERQ